MTRQRKNDLHRSGCGVVFYLCRLENGQFLFF